MARLPANIVKVFKRHRKLAWLCLLVALVSIGLTLWSYNSEPRAPLVSAPIAAAIFFQSYSNSPSGQRWAILTVTNSDFGTLYFAAGSFLVELSNQPSSYLDADWQRPRSLPPHSTATVAVPIPADLGPWRASCMIVRDTWRNRVPNVFPRWWPDWLNPSRRTRTADGLVSDWVSSEAAQPDKQPH